MMKWWDKIKEFFRVAGNRREVVSDVIKNKHRFVVIDEETYKEKMSFQLSGINLFVSIGIIIIVFVLLTFLLIAFTPLRELIPGYTNPKMTEQAYANAVAMDSLEYTLAMQSRQLQDIKAIMMGENPDSLHLARRDTAAAGLSQEGKQQAATYQRSKEDSLLRLEVENADKYSLKAPNRNGDAGNKSRANNRQGREAMVKAAQEPTSAIMQLFFTPVKGTVVSTYDPKIRHYGIDIAAAENEAVKAVLGGTVIFSNFTVETGYVIAVQHANNYISVYKHNSALLKHAGDIVRAGEPIAFVGNSGHLTTGPHLHFELWMNGNAVNPQQYISF